MPNNVTFKVFQDVASHPDVVEGIGELLVAVEEHDGVAALSEAFVRGVKEEQGHRHVLAFEASSESSPVGILGIDPSSTVELAVLPSRRHHGIGRELLNHAIEEFDLEGALEVWAHGDSPAAQKLVESVGARRTRELLKMTIDVIPGSMTREKLVEGCAQAREKIADQNILVLDYQQAVDSFGQDLVDEEWVRVNNEAFAWHPEQGGWDLARLSDARDTSWFSSEGVWMLWTEEEASEQSRCLGFHWTKIPLDQKELPESERTGEVYVVCLADEARGRGLGGPVTLVGMGYLLEQGVGKIELYVEGDNAPAVATYQRLGFSVVQTDVVYRGEKREFS